ncbi:MAG: hypothetical protein HY862_07440 [Chloroflexi bacterium]|nr:hypothetical protein [Chloroflexota bacterium]
MLRCLGQILGFMLLATLVIWIPCAVYVLVSWDYMSKENTYTQLDREFYEKLRPLVIPAFLQAQINGADDGSDTERNLTLLREAINNTDADVWDNISADLVSIDRVQEQFETNAVVAVEYFNDKREYFDVTFDSATLRETLNGPQGSQAIVQMMDSWDNCSPSQETEVNDYLAGTADSIPFCQPRNPTAQQALQQNLQGYMNLLADSLPDQFILRNEITNHQTSTLKEVDQSFEEVRKGVLFFDRLLPLAGLVPLMLFALLVMVAVRSFKDFFLWGGLTLAISGLFVFIPLFAWLSNLVSSPQAITTNPLQQLAGDAIIAFQRSIAQDMLGPLGVLGIGMLILGVMGIVIAAVVRGPEDEPEQQMFYLTPNPNMGYPQGPMMPPPTQTLGSTPAPRPTPPPVPRPVTPPPAPKPPTDSQESNIVVDFGDDKTITPSDSNPFKDEAGQA